MSLHHRCEMDDIRAAYAYDETASAPSRSRWQADVPRSHREMLRGIDQSYSSQPPARRLRGVPTRKAGHTTNVIHYDTSTRYFDDMHFQESPKSSEESIASTVESEEEYDPDVLDYDVPAPSIRPCNDGSTILESTPKDFSDLFPSSRQLLIRHDDTTLDGNMNLRIDAQVRVGGQPYDMTLFHLRMHDLKDRHFSFRRHHRDSGREICHSLLKAAPPKRPGFQRSLSNALNSMRPKYEHRASTSPSLARHDSGYGSMYSMDFDDTSRPTSAGRATDGMEELPTNSIKLEFSNYAQVEVKRAGRNSTRYEFEYWGIHYYWKRIPHGPSESVPKAASFHLKRAGSGSILALIVPLTLTARQAAEERSKGGWVPPCTLQIIDEHTIHSQKDVADIVVAAGLIAVVDDSIRARFLSKTDKSIIVPNVLSSLHIQRLGPKQLINDIFHRKDHGAPLPNDRAGLHSHSSDREYESRRPGTLRRAHYTF